MQRRIGYEIREIQQMIHQKMEQFRHEDGYGLTLVQTRTICFLLPTRTTTSFSGIWKRNCASAGPQPVKF